MIKKHSNTGGWIRSALWLAMAVVAGLWVVTATSGANAAPQSPPEDVAAPSPAPSLAAQDQATEAPTPEAVVTDPKTKYGPWTVLPALVAIVFAIATRQVIPSLILGILTGAFMMVPCLPSGDPYAGSNSFVTGIRLAAEKYTFGALSDPEDGYSHLKIAFFTLLIGFTIGVIGRNGGTTGLVTLIAGNAQSRRRGALTAWLAGLVVFFDDYANTMIVGPTMRSVFDRLKISRAKLAYIVDSTAAPVASIALIGTWVGYEVGLIDQGLKTVTTAGAPAFLLDANGTTIGPMTAFVQSIAYRFYPILALFLVFLIALTGRDFGPMKRSERKVLSQIDADPTETLLDSSGPKPRWWLGFVPIMVLVTMTVVVLIATGTTNPEMIELVNAVGEDGTRLWEQRVWWEKASEIFGHADSYLAIFYGSIFASIVAVVLTLLARACRLGDTIDAGLDGMTKIYPAVVILVLAWALSGVVAELQLGAVAGDWLRESNFNAKWLPAIVFASAAFISFSTGTSYGTMAILCPVTIQVGARLLTDLPQPEALTLFYASIGSVLAGAVFGDHCSPISDTTVLSSLASGCPHEEHVWTQIPYALLTAVAAMALGDVMCSVYGQPWYYGLGAGALFLTLWIFVVGRRPVPSFELAEG